MHKGLMAIFFIFLAFFNCQAKTIAFLVENSPYYVQKDLLVNKGDTFTVEPGVVIEVAKGVSVIIEGRVDIAGYPGGGEVIFKAVGPPQNYHKGFWRGIIIKSKEENVIQYAVVQHSRIGIELTKGSCANLNNNIITQNKAGIRAEGAKELFIVRNSFLDNFIDIEVINGAGSVGKNYFEGSLTCLRLKQGYPRIERNFFKQAYKNLIESYNESELQAGENWWGSANEGLIKNRIFRRGKGKFIFKPYLLEPPDLGEVGVDLKNNCTSCR